MALYDHVIVHERLLPEEIQHVIQDAKENAHDSWQTKDFACDLDYYEIDESGALLRHEGRVAPRHVVYTGAIRLQNDIGGSIYQLRAEFADGRVADMVVL